MPYLDASPTSLQRMIGIPDSDLPDGAVLMGQWNQAAYFDRIRAIWPNARETEGHSLVIEEDGKRIWISVVFGGAMAATIAHLAVKLGARAVIQIGSMGGLAEGWRVGDILVPSLVVGRDGVSRQLSRGRPIEPNASLSSVLRDELARVGAGPVHSGTLVSTTTIALERTSDVARWRRHGFAGVEMECAATKAIASYFRVPTAGAFVLMDNLAAEHTVFALSEDDRRKIRAGKEATLRAAVAACLQSS